MAKKKKGKKGAQDAPPPPPKRSLFGRLAAALVTLVVLLVIAYIGLRMIGTTNGFRYYVEEHLSEAWNCTVTVEDSRLTRWLDLHLKGISGYVDSGEDTVGEFFLSRVWVDLDHGARLRGDRDQWIREVRAEQGSVEFSLDRDGVMQPAVFRDVWSGFMDLTGIQAAAERGTPLMQTQAPYLRGLKGLPRLHVTGLDISEDGNTREDGMMMEQAEILYMPLDIPGRDLHYIRIDSMFGGFRRASYKDLGLEWVAGDQAPSILANRIEWLTTHVPPNRDPRFSDPKMRNAAFQDALKKNTQPREAVEYYLNQPALDKKEVERELKDALK